MSLKLKIRLSILLLLLLLLGLGGYALLAMRHLESGAHGIEPAEFRAARLAVLGFVLTGAAVGITMMVRLPRAVTRPLRRLTAEVEDVAGPSSTNRVAIRRHDEVGTVAMAVNRVLAQAQNERRATLAELFTERNRMDSLMRSLDEGLLMLDEQGIVVLANPAACSLLGFTQAELLGKSAHILAQTNQALRELLEPLAAANLAGDDVPDPVFTFRHKGDAPHYQLSISPIESTDGPAGHILCLRNVSDFKKLDQVKSHFLATVSHELKTPLSSINLSLMLLRDERTDTGERQRLVAGIGEETQRLLKLVGQLIDVSRLDAGAGLQLNLQPMCLSDVVRYATDVVRPQLHDKQLELQLELAPKLPTVLGDVEKTTWVLINLLSNAIRYSPAGAPLGIRVLPWGEMVRLSVHDQGPGIPAQYQKRIFERFAGVPSPEGHSGGSGLGLSISHAFIKAQGGLLWVESKPPSGSCFLFTLPVCSADSASPLVGR